MVNGGRVLSLCVRAIGANGETERRRHQAGFPEQSRGLLVISEAWRGSTTPCRVGRQSVKLSPNTHTHKQSIFLERFNCSAPPLNKNLSLRRDSGRYSGLSWKLSDLINLLPENRSEKGFWVHFTNMDTVVKGRQPIKPLQMADSWSTGGDLHPMAPGSRWGWSQPVYQTLTQKTKCCFLEQKEPFWAGSGAWWEPLDLRRVSSQPDERISVIRLRCIHRGHQEVTRVRLLFCCVYED